MTCYFRHLRGVFQRAGIEVTKENRQDIDRAIHDIVSAKYKTCPAAWKKVKKRITEDEDAFAHELRKTLNETK